jgi:hypothetical protein
MVKKTFNSVMTEALSRRECFELLEKYIQLSEFNKGRILQHVDELLDAQEEKKGKLYYFCQVNNKAGE